MSIDFILVGNIVVGSLLGGALIHFGKKVFK